MVIGRDVIRLLADRKGFDWWWDDLDAESRADIIKSLDQLLIGDPRHIIDVQADGWTIQHPLSCRPNLLDCLVAKEASLHHPDGHSYEIGRYVCSLDDEHGVFVMGERLDGNAGS
jgi:hypothetical protein